MQESDNSGQTPWDDRYWYSRDGLRLHYREYSGPDERPPVICLHGLTRNGRDFEDVAEWLAGQWRVIVPDFRGRGLSDHDPLPARYTPPTYAADILQLMDLLGMDAVAFIGTSLGGLVTMAIAAVAADRIAGVVLNDVGPQLGAEGLARIRGYVGRLAVFQNWEEAARGLADRNHSIYPGYGEADWLRMAHRMCREEGPSDIRFDYDMAIARNVLASGATPAVDAWPLFRALAKAPLLIVHGERSDLLSLETAERMVEEHPDAERVGIPDVGHAPDLNEPQARAGIVRLLAKVALCPSPQ